jgi:glycosyltransferase involved in cell wall biosynthesis
LAVQRRAFIRNCLSGKNNSSPDSEKIVKVLYLIDTLETGGSEQSLLNILSRFKQVKPLVCHVYPGETLKPAFEAAGIPVISLNMPGRYNFRRAIDQVTKLLRAEQPDLLHTTLFRADVIGRAAGRLTRLPVLSSFINEPYHPDRWATISTTKRLKLKAVQLIDRLTARWACHFIAVSEPTRAANCRALGIPPEKVTVIYRGRDPQPFLNVSAQARRHHRLALGLPLEAPILLNVARLLQRKGQNELIQAMPLVLQKFPQAQLLIAGEGHDRPMLEATIKDLGLDHAVRLPGRRDDIPELLHLADLFVFPSYYEGHPGSLVEAMLAARPIVASDIPVHREAIVDKETGCLVSTRNPQAIAQVIIWMLAHSVEAERMGLQARQTALARFQIDRIAAEHETLYEKIKHREVIK